jgi:predicted amidohydrolase YtcJ
MRRTLVNARIPGERGLFGSGINVVIDDGIITDIEFIGQTGSFTLPHGVGGADEVIDLGGRYLIPGLWDSHVHFAQWAQTRRRLDLSEAQNPTHAAEIVATYLANRFVDAGSSAAQEVVGFGWRGTFWQDTPHKELLDRYTGSTPVVLFSVDLHSVWLNSAALATRGIVHPTGLLVEEECYAVDKSVQQVSDDVLDEWVHEASREAAARGVVGVVDFELAWNAESWRRRIRNGNDLLRVEFGIYPDDLNRAIESGLRTGDIIASTEGLLSVGPLKVITDGSLGSKTAYCSHAYPGMTGARARGILNVPPKELRALMRAANDNGLDSAIHAIGDEANKLALDAFEAVGAQGSIEHAQLVSQEDIERMAGLDIIASVQPEHLMDDRDAIEELWGGQESMAFPLAQMLDADVVLRFGSDAPVAPLDPWHAISSAVGRSRDGREPWHPDQAISVEDALAASSRTRFAVGEPADLVAVDIDPLSCSVDELRTMPVAATFLAGRPTFLSI